MSIISIKQKLKNILLDLASKQEIDLDILIEDGIAYWESNPYNVEKQLIGSSGEWEIDEEKLEKYQIEKLIEMFTNDSFGEFINLNDKWLTEYENDSKIYNRTNKYLISFLEDLL